MSAISSISRQPLHFTSSTLAPDQTKATLAPAKFSDMVRCAVAAAVDSDNDQLVSAEEYRTQIVAGGGSGIQADAQYQALDKNADSKVTTDELASSMDDPVQGNDRDRLLQQIMNELRAGQNALPPQGMVLNAQGQIADTHAAMRYVALHFPGNVNVT